MNLERLALGNNEMRLDSVIKIADGHPLIPGSIGYLLPFDDLIPDNRKPGTLIVPAPDQISSSAKVCAPADLTATASCGLPK